MTYLEKAKELFLQYDEDMLLMVCPDELGLETESKCLTVERFRYCGSEKCDNCWNREMSEVKENE